MATKLKDVVERLGLEVWTHGEKGDLEVTGGYAGDLLSDVLANSEPGDLWVTVQVHPNIVGVAAIKDLTAIILVNGRRYQEETIKKAQEQGIVLASTSLSTFEVVGRLYKMLKDEG